jgi:hypothetical protein
MPYRPHGRAQVNPDSPRAFARCDRCGFLYNHYYLRFQYDYRGPQLANLRFLVCAECYDTPQPQLKPIILTQDPPPIVNPRPEDYTYANSSDVFAQTPTTTDVTTGIPVPQGSDLATEAGDNIIVQPTGYPAGLTPSAIPPLYIGTAYNVAIPVLSVTSVGTPIISVTCSAPHGLNTNDQISAEGLANPQACGIYSVTVISATVFTYQVNSNIVSAGLLTPNSLIATALVGLPPENTQIPLTGAS